MRPAWSVILLTTLIGAAQGLFLVVFFIDISRSPPGDFIVLSCGISLFLLACGLVASFFHLGRPERAWRAVVKWRTSWLSREVIILPAFMGLVFLYGVLHYQNSDKTMLIGSLAALCCIALFVCTAMIYACLKFLQEWHTPLTLVNFVLLGLASGLTLSVPLAVLRYPQFAGPLALAAFGAGALAWIVRIATLIRNARLRPKSTMQSAIGITHPKIAQKSQGFMGGSFNTREFFPGKPKPVVTAVRWAFLILIFPVPAWLLGWGGGSMESFIAAFAVQFAGLLAERWYFFAEARHPQNLYYQAAS
jgi:DMSO reductase anchor subunit